MKARILKIKQSRDKSMGAFRAIAKQESMRAMENRAKKRTKKTNHE